MASAILFDLGGVLLEPHPERAIEALSIRSGRSPEELAPELLGVAKLGFDTGRIGPEGFAAAVGRAAGLPLSVDEVRALWCDIFDDLRQMQELAAALARRHPCYLLSNTDPMHFACALGRLPVLSRFRGQQLSYEVGLLKPDPEYYRAAFRRFGLRPEECVLVDDLRPNVEAIVREGAAGIVHEGTEATKRRLAELGLSA